MDRITVTAKTLDEAITKALIDLGTTSDNLDYEIVDKGSTGFLGLFAKNVVIRAKKKKEDDDLEAFLTTGKIDSTETVKEKKKEEKDTRELGKETPKEAPKKNNQKNQKTQKNQSRNQQKAQKDETVLEAKEVFKNVKPAPKAVKSEAAENTYQILDEDEEKKPAKKVDVDACMAASKEFLNQVFAAMGMEVEVTAAFDEKEKELTVDMAGADMGILIGKRGQTLDSLQYLTSLVVNKECDGYVRVKLDTENYRARRKDTLESLAKNIAYKVKRTRRNVSLEPMNPYERRIIHAALQNDKYVVTRSEGEDPFRHVVICLKRDGRERREGKKGQDQ